MSSSRGWWVSIIMITGWDCDDREVVAAETWVHEDGHSLSDMADITGMQPNRLRRLVDRRTRATDG